MYFYLTLFSPFLRFVSGYCTDEQTSHGLLLSHLAPLTTYSRSAARLSARNCNTLTFASERPSRKAVSLMERLSRKRQFNTSRYCSGSAERMRCTYSIGP